MKHVVGLIIVLFCANTAMAESDIVVLDPKNSVSLEAATIDWDTKIVQIRAQKLKAASGGSAVKNGSTQRVEVPRSGKQGTAGSIKSTF